MTTPTNAPSRESALGKPPVFDDRQSLMRREKLMTAIVLAAGVLALITGFSVVKGGWEAGVTLLVLVGVVSFAAVKIADLVRDEQHERAERRRAAQEHLSAVLTELEAAGADEASLKMLRLHRLEKDGLCFGCSAHWPCLSAQTIAEHHGIAVTAEPRAFQLRPLDGWIR